MHTEVPTRAQVEKVTKPTDMSTLIAGLARDQIILDLKTLDLCFLAGLYLRAKYAGLASFEEDTLIDMFEQSCDIVDPGAEQTRLRATNAIQRLRDQRMLARVDGAGLVRAGEYTLTRLAAAIIEYFIADEALTRESLTLLTGTLLTQLVAIRASAATARTDADWREQVLAPLRVTVSDLVGGIENRQRGMDAQQEEVQAEIAKLLQIDWFGAVERCQALLDMTTNTLRELNEILLRDTPRMVTMLQEIQGFAAAAGHVEAEAAAQRVIEHVDRITAWGGARLRAWSDYYQYVHRYLRDVVRLDPDRALSQRLRDLVAGWAKSPFCMMAVAQPSIYLLRPLELQVERPAVMRPRVDRETSPDIVDPEDTNLDIETLIQTAIDEGAQSLAEITEQVLPNFAAYLHYAVTGRTTEALARLARVHSAYERTWKPVSETIELEDWDLQRERNQ